MGCCVSAQNAPATTASQHQDRPISPPGNRRNHHDVSKSPPRAEEEAVKEVLSEIPQKPTTTNNNGFTMAAPGEEQYSIDEITKSPPVPDLMHLCASPGPTVIAPDEISEVSEISCLSQTVSAASAGGEVRLRVSRSQSPGKAHKAASMSGESAARRERLTGKSPVRRSDPSPRRPRPNRESSQVVDRPRWALGSGEGSGRRSRSPATRNETAANRSNLGRSLSGRKTGLSPGRVRMVQPGGGSDGGCRKGERSGRMQGMEGNKWGPVPTAPNESLDNPLVTLECFIFL